VTLRIGTEDIAGRPASDAIEEFARQVGALSGGKLRIEPVWDADGGDRPSWDQRVARRVVSGDLDMGMIPARAWDTEGVTSLRALHAPFLVTSDSLLHRVVTGRLAEELLAGLDEAGVVGLALVPESLRHPFGFGEPLLSLEHYDGVRIRTPRSDVAYALFRALGATPEDMSGDAFTEAIERGTVAGADSSFSLASTLPTRVVVTGNVTLFPKANTLVVSAKVLDDLDDAQRRILERAAARTRAWAIAEQPSDAEAARAFCAGGGTVVLAREADIAALEQAAAPVYEELERDSETRRLVDAIRELKASVPSGVGVAPCKDPADDTVVPGGAGRIPDGVYRAALTEDELVAAGLTASEAGEHTGVHTITLADGKLLQEHRHEDRRLPSCPAAPYSASAKTVEFTWQSPCSGGMTAAWSFDDGSLRFDRIVGTLPGETRVLRAVFGTEPWRKVGDVEPRRASFPEGAYRTELTSEYLLRNGFSTADANYGEGLQTLTFRRGRWAHATTQNATNPPVCEGPYRVENGRVVVSFDTSTARCGVADTVLFSATWTLAGGVLRFTDVRAGSPEFDQSARVLWGGTPWRKLG
jgi:TRAP-type C4-dicarboxylate transport system substrate-binding protein